MAETTTNLYRALIGDDAAKWTRVAKATDTVETLKPKAGVLDPQWVEKTFLHKPTGQMRTRAPDVTLTPNKDDPSKFDVEADGRGTSLHDKPGWFGSKEFWIPQGTIYSTEIEIAREDKLKWNPKQTVQGTHYQLQPKNKMLESVFAGHLDNMARAAIARQIEVAKASARTPVRG